MTELSRTDIIKISKTAARWILHYGSDLVNAGLGEDENGIIDEIPIDLPAYRYTQSVIQFIRTIVSIVATELDESQEI